MRVRLRQVALVARSLPPVLADLQAVFGLEVSHRDPAVAAFGLENAVLPVGGQFLEVVAPTRPGTAAGRYLERRGGDGGYMVITQVDDQPGVRRRLDELSVRTVLDHDVGGYRCLQLHPADTGGSFLEVDHQDGSWDTYGAWAPAGPDWPAAVRTAVVDGIRGVDVQSDRTGALAARWAEILATDPRLDGSGRPVLGLDDAFIRFPPLADDRGEGLAGIELAAVDAETAREVAAARGLLDGAAIVVGGVRVTLHEGGATTAEDHRRAALLGRRPGAGG
jgi:hypothetical protein